MRLDAVEALLCNYVFCILCAFVKAANTIEIKSGLLQSDDQATEEQEIS